MTDLEDASPAFLWMCRTLTLLIVLLLAVIPWSERYSGLDNFPHGEDTELNLLAFFLVLGLILLFARSCSKGLSAFLAVFYLFLFLLRFESSLFPDPIDAEALCIPHSPPIPGTPLHACSIPLLI